MVHDDLLIDQYNVQRNHNRSPRPEQAV